MRRKERKRAIRILEPLLSIVLRYYSYNKTTLPRASPQTECLSFSNNRLRVRRLLGK